jgi:fluoroquinolone resistance protein
MNFMKADTKDLKMTKRIGNIDRNPNNAGTFNQEVMATLFAIDRQFDKMDFAAQGVEVKEFENCVFRSCQFPGVDLAGVSFVDCEFTDCDFSMAKLKNTAFKNVEFKNCKQLGLRFDECSPRLISFSFESCVLNFSSFYRLKIKGTRFRKCKLEAVDFVESDLTGSEFVDSDLTDATFENTVLEGVDFRTAHHYLIDPELNRVSKAKFSIGGLPGLLGKYNIGIE